MRPTRVGTMTVLPSLLVRSADRGGPICRSVVRSAGRSDLLAGGPPPPAGQGRRRAHSPAEATPGDVVHDLLRGDLQAQEGVHAGERTTQRGGAGDVQPAHAAVGT